MSKIGKEIPVGEGEITRPIYGQGVGLHGKIASFFSMMAMYVCIEVALRGSAHEIGRPTGPGGGAHHRSGSNAPTPRYHYYCVTHAGLY